MGPRAGWLCPHVPGRPMVAMLVVAAVLLSLAGWSLFQKIRHDSAFAQAELLPSRPCTFRNTVILPVPAKPNRAVLGAVEYAQSISADVIAVHVLTGGQHREELLSGWKKFVDGVPLIVLDSPHRSVLRPLVQFIDEIRDLRNDQTVTVVLTEVVPASWWQKLLHNQITSLLKDELDSRPGVVVTSVRHYLRPDSEVQRKDW